MTDRIVLACAGGLDPSVTVGWIAEQGQRDQRRGDSRLVDPQQAP